MYCLPKFKDVFFLSTDRDIIMRDRRQDIAAYPRRLFEHASMEDLWRYHRKTALQYRRAQRLWRLGAKYLPMLHPAILRMLDAQTPPNPAWAMRQ